MSKLVSVVMPVYNAEKFVGSALKSIIRQTYKNIEIVIVNDGSTDQSLKIIESIKDSRVRIINNDFNLKIVKCLNLGIQSSQGEIISRMDADDIANPKRIELQLEHMAANPDVALLGTWFEFMGTNTLVKFPVDCESVQSRLFYSNALGHPTVMINRKIVGDDFYYSEDHLHAEDYELWNRLAFKYKIENLRKNLLSYRLHSNQISSAFADSQTEVVRKIRAENLRRLKVQDTEGNLNLLEEIFSDAQQSLPSKSACELGKVLIDQNLILKVYSHDNFRKYVESSLSRKRPSVFQHKYPILSKIKSILIK